MNTRGLAHTFFMCANDLYGYVGMQYFLPLGGMKCSEAFWESRSFSLYTLHYAFGDPWHGENNTIPGQSHPKATQLPHIHYMANKLCRTYRVLEN